MPSGNAGTATAPAVASRNGATPTRRKKGNLHPELADVDLSIIEREAEKLSNHSLNLQTRLLINDLIQKRKLPHFYFHEEAKRAGIDPEISRAWRIRDWPVTRMRNQTRMKEITQVLLRVQLRLWAYPQNETYWEANEQFKRRIRDLKAKGHTHNRISQLLRMSFKTLEEIMHKTEKGNCRPRHCPWNLLRRLEEAESSLNKRKSNGRTPTDSRNPNGLKAETEEEEMAYLLAMEQLVQKVIAIRGTCWHCQSEWPNLRYEGELGTPVKYRVYKCCNCERENVTYLPKIEMYGECASCGKGWHNLKQPTQGHDGNTIRLCMLCLSHNTIISKEDTKAGESFNYDPSLDGFELNFDDDIDITEESNPARNETTRTITSKEGKGPKTLNKTQPESAATGR